MTTIEILGAEPPPDPPGALKGRVVVLTVALLIAIVALLALLTDPEVFTDPEAEQTDPSVGDSDEPPTTLVPTTTSTTTTSTAPATTAAPTYPVVTWTVAPIPNERAEMELPPADFAFDYVSATANGIDLVRNDPTATFSMAGPPTRLAFGFDGPVIVHQAGTWDEPLASQPLIRVTTAEQTRTLPTNELSNVRLLGAAEIEGHQIVLFASIDDVNIVSLHVVDLDTAAATDLGSASLWQSSFVDAYLEVDGVYVYYSDRQSELWDLGGNVTVLDEEVCGC